MLVVWKLDRLGRTLAHLVNLVQDLSARGVGLRVRTGQGAQIDTTPAAGRHGGRTFALSKAQVRRLQGQLRSKARRSLPLEPAPPQAVSGLHCRWPAGPSRCVIKKPPHRGPRLGSMCSASQHSSRWSTGSRLAVLWTIGRGCAPDGGRKVRRSVIGWGRGADAARPHLSMLRQDPDHDAAVLRPPFRGVVRCRRAILAEAPHADSVQRHVVLGRTGRSSPSRRAACRAACCGAPNRSSPCAPRSRSTRSGGRPGSGPPADRSGRARHPASRPGSTPNCR